jgi:hypothetical protein
MKKTLGAIVLAACIGGISAMDVGMKEQNREQKGMECVNVVHNANDTSANFESGHALIIVRRAEDTFSVTFTDDMPTILLEKNVTIPSLEVESSLSIGNGIKISKKENGDFILNLTKDFVVPNRIKRLSILFPDGYVEISGTLRCKDRVAAYCKSLITSGTIKTKSLHCSPAEMLGLNFL